MADLKRFKLLLHCYNAYGIFFRKQFKMARPKVLGNLVKNNFNQRTLTIEASITVLKVYLLFDWFGFCSFSTYTNNIYSSFVKSNPVANLINILHL